MIWQYFGFKLELSDQMSEIFKYLMEPHSLLPTRNVQVTAAQIKPDLY